MKSKLFLLSALCLSALAHADTLSLQLPVSHFSPLCGNAPINEQTATGFSPDGSFVLVQAHGYTACGSHGTSYVYWCDALMFDLSGTLVNESVIPLTNNTCPYADPRLTFQSQSGYSSFSTFNWNYTQTVPELQTPSNPSP